VLM
jgi:hypothetical protein